MLVFLRSVKDVRNGGGDMTYGDLVVTGRFQLPVLRESPIPTGGPVPADPLLDGFQRRIRYLRVSVTDRCNYRCSYCMPEDVTFRPRAELLTFEETARLVRVFAEDG